MTERWPLLREKKVSLIRGVGVSPPAHYTCNPSSPSATQRFLGDREVRRAHASPTTGARAPQLRPPRRLALLCSAACRAESPLDYSRAKARRLRGKILAPRRALGRRCARLDRARRRLPLGLLARRRYERVFVLVLAAWLFCARPLAGPSRRLTIRARKRAVFAARYSRLGPHRALGPQHRNPPTTPCSLEPSAIKHHSRIPAGCRPTTGPRPRL